MRFRIALVIAALAAPATAPAAAEAQLFGTPRNLGGTLSRRPPPGMGDAGTITGNERFLRGNRGAGEFVGTDAREQRRFVGTQRLAQGRVQAATNTLRPEPPPRVNQPLPASGGGRAALYEPRLAVGFEVTRPPAHQLEQVLAARLEELLSSRRWGQIEVSVAGRRATLRGAVASAADRRLVEALVRFEPGIADVQNDLRVTSPPPSPAPPPNDRPSRPGEL